MYGERDESTISRRLLILMGAALAAFTLCAWKCRASVPSSGLLSLLVGLAMVAEFLPVELPRRGVRITFALPFVAAVAVFIGGFTALLVDLLATTFVSLLLGRGLPKVREAKWIAANAAISSISAALAGFVSTSPLLKPGAPEIAAILYVAAYAAVNLLLVAYIEWVLTDRAWSENTSAMSGTALLGFALYSAVALLVVVMIREQLFVPLPLTLLPVWALRTGLSYRSRMDRIYYETISALSQMLQRAHPYTHGHLERVSRTAEEVAFRLGLSARRARLVREAAVLHDIGKIAVNEEVLDKPGKLTAEELTHVRLHASFGATILEPVRTFAPIVPWVRHHHERPDGAGYPSGLPDMEIPIESKIIAVVDAFDAMIGDENGTARAYRQPMSEADALNELERCAGTQFDAEVVRAFREVVTR